MHRRGFDSIDARLRPGDVIHSLNRTPIEFVGQLKSAVRQLNRLDTVVPRIDRAGRFRGYYDFRFHDRNLLLASAGSRWALRRDVDVAAFFEAGNVAARTGDLNLKKTSGGIGLRLHNRTATLARIDIAHGHEGWRCYASLDDPFRLKRLLRRGPDVPFLP